jgi:hypothetical protein
MGEAPGSITRIKGVPFFGIGGEFTTGNVFWVDSGIGVSDQAYGGSPDYPYASIDYAVGRCTANNGDIIYAMPGHAETISAAAGLALDVAGIRVVGLGYGTDIPTLTYSATTSTTVVSAANCKIKNIRFVSAINNLAVFVTVSANHCTIENCIFQTSSTLEAYNFIGLTTTYDYLTVTGCRFIQPTDPEGTDAAVNTGAIYFVDSEYVTVEDCQFVGNFETAIFHNKTTAAGQLWVKRCYGYNDLSTAKIYLLVEGATGGDFGSLYTNPNATDATTAQLFGTESTKFFTSSYFGNDSVGGGQGAVQVTAAS